MCAPGSITPIGRNATFFHRRPRNAENPAARRDRIFDGRKSRGQGGRIYGVRAEFKDRGGRVHAYRSGWKSSNPGYAVGEPIRIYYDPQNPDRCGIATFGMRYGVAAGLLFTGLLLLAARWGLRAGQAWFEQAYPLTLGPG